MEDLEAIYEHIDENLEEHVEKLRKFLKQRGVSLTEPLYTNNEVVKSAQMLLDYVNYPRLKARASSP